MEIHNFISIDKNKYEPSLHTSDWIKFKGLKITSAGYEATGTLKYRLCDHKSERLWKTTWHFLVNLIINPLEIDNSTNRYIWVFMNSGYRKNVYRAALFLMEDSWQYNNNEQNTHSARITFTS